MDRSLDDIISARPYRGPGPRSSRPDTRRPPPSAPAPPPPRGPRREEYPRDGIRKNRHHDDERVNFNSDWVHDRFDEEGGYEREQLHRRRSELDRHGNMRRDVEADGSKIRVDNLHYELTEDDLHDLFNRIGPVLSVRLLYDRMDRSQGTAFVTYDNSRDARRAIDEFHGQNAYGQPIRLSLVPTAPMAKAPVSSSLFNRVERPTRSLFERIEGGPDARDDGSRGYMVAPRRRTRSSSPRIKPAPDHVDRYVPGARAGGSRSPIRRRGGTPRESGRRPGQRRDGSGRPGDRRSRADDDGHRVVRGRPKKTAEELDAEMEDYWGAKGGDTAVPKATVPQNGVATALAVDDDIDMIE